MSPRALRAGLPVLLAALAETAAAQDALAPCRQVLPEPAGYVAAFETQGWTFAKDDRSQALALAQLRPGAYYARTWPRPPGSPEEHARLLERAAASNQDRAFEEALLFTRGDAAAAVVFNAELGIGGLRLDCWVAAPHLVELDALPLAPHEQEGGIDTVILGATASLPPPPGATELEVWSSRLQSAFATGEPVPGADVQILSLVREEPRFTLPELYGPLRAFGSDEMADALRGALE